MVNSQRYLGAIDDDTLSGVEMTGEESKSSDVERQANSNFAVARNESKVVQLMRILVVTVLFATTVTVSLTTYKHTSSKQASDFRQNFESDSNKVLDVVGYDLDRALIAVDSAIVAMVSFARFTNQTWPFVTIPNFELRMAKLRSLCKSIFIQNYMVVLAHQRDEWEIYTSENNAWVNESIYMQAHNPNFHGPIVFDYETYDFIHDYDNQPRPHKEVYLALWQSTPMIPKFTPYNFDLLDYDPNISSVSVMQTHKALLCESYHLPNLDDPEEMADNDADVEWYQDYVRPGQDAGEPCFDIMYPILDSVDEIQVSNPQAIHLGGIMTVTVYWRDLFERILPEGSDGVVIVLENACNPTCTYQINGPSVEYLGRGDLHDPAYDEYKVQTKLLDLDAFQSDYAGVELEREFCQHSFRLYPSSTYKNKYITTQPLILTISAIMIFLFTSAVYIGYDWVVEYRQKLVLTSAMKNSKIVSSLFPETVHAQLLEDRDDEIPVHRNNPFKGGGKNNNYLVSGGIESGDANDQRASRPIAELYQNTTVFFADMVGFTTWSSTRSPSEVFEFLEEIYGLFDSIAKRRNVFKVETIGDCYVAVTGIPKPQKYHAVIMVQFARECMMTLSKTTNDLAKRFGEDTKDLTMRIGLHSGPTTAGVLRGERSRFQLFGDTVNTASRMESTGVKGRIHVSQSTADELIGKGRGHWLSPREEKLSVKGKGAMQTYFVVVSDPTTTESGEGSAGDMTTGGGSSSGATAYPAVPCSCTQSSELDDHDLHHHDTAKKEEPMFQVKNRGVFVGTDNSPVENHNGKDETNIEELACNSTAGAEQFNWIKAKLQKRLGKNSDISRSL